MTINLGTAGDPRTFLVRTALLEEEAAGVGPHTAETVWTVVTDSSDQNVAAVWTVGTVGDEGAGGVNPCLIVTTINLHVAGHHPDAATHLRGVGHPGMCILVS